jgi:hypothetical protein
LQPARRIIRHSWLANRQQRPALHIKQQDRRIAITSSHNLKLILRNDTRPEVV